MKISSGICVKQNITDLYNNKQETSSNNDKINS